MQKEELWVKAWLLMAQAEFRAYSVLSKNDNEPSDKPAIFADKAVKEYEERFKS